MLEKAAVSREKHKNSVFLQHYLISKQFLLLQLINQLTMEHQLNKILATLQTITIRIDALDQKMNGFTENLNDIKLMFSNRCDDIEKKLTNSQNEVDEMKAVLDNLVRFKDQKEQMALLNES